MIHLNSMVALYELTATCSECEKEFSVKCWKPGDGYKARCPHCGAENNFMCDLCGEYVWGVLDGRNECDWCVSKENGCKFERMMKGEMV